MNELYLPAWSIKIANMYIHTFPVFYSFFPQDQVVPPRHYNAHVRIPIKRHDAQKKKRLWLFTVARDRVNIGLFSDRMEPTSTALVDFGQNRISCEITTKTVTRQCKVNNRINRTELAPDNPFAYRTTCCNPAGWSGTRRIMLPD